MRNLTEIALIKAMANRIGITELSQKGDRVLFTFAEGRIEDGFISLILDEYYDTCAINAKKPVITYKVGQGKLLPNIKFLLQRLNELHKEDK